MPPNKRRIVMRINHGTDVLLIVDFQNDFITGSLAVPGAEDLIPIINKYISMFWKIVLSRDRHKKGHPSFAAQGGIWPDHCIDGTFGMEIHPKLSFPEGMILPIIDKGRDKEAYSAFERTDMADLLGAMWAKRLFICGLATDYCVKNTALDAVKEFAGEVFLLTDAIKAVNVNPADGEKAIKEMKDAGVILITLDDLED